MAENLGIVADLVRPATEEIGKSIVTMIKRECNYMCCFSRNVADLTEKSEKLKDKKAGLQKRVVEVKNNALEILPEVDTWLKHVDEQQKYASEILKESLDINYGCFTMKGRYSLSKKAKKAIKSIERYLQEHKELGNHISVPAPPASQASIPLVSTLDFTSRQEIEEAVLTALTDEKLTLIGICGMGGVGKTTLAKKLRHIVIENGLFDETVIAIVGQNVDLSKIQLEIAEQVGFNKIKEKDTFQARAYDLRDRLKMRRTLIILDDIWKKINLEDLGIPCEGNFKDCKVLLTGREREVMNKMSAKIFGMKILSPEEAWDLFKDKSKICEDDFDLVSIARKVAEECKGLPLAIVNVGISLKDKEKHIWEDALDRLRSSNPKYMSRVLEDVYQPLRLSYDFLKDQDAKSLLLLCSQFPEDFNISLEVLTLYSMGLDMLEGVDSLKQARNGVVFTVDKLKNNFLLMDGECKNTVKVHDVIRDVVRIIAFEEGLVVDTKHKSRGHGASSCQWIFEFPEIKGEFPDYLIEYNFPNLLLLLIHKELGWWNAMGHNYYNDHLKKSMLEGQLTTMKISDFSFIEKMEDLHVLSFKEMSFKALPQTMELLKHLKALYLYNCTLNDISIVGKLFTLEILSCIWCINIEEMPFEIGNLKHLKLLDFSYSKRLDRISPGIISNLKKLEELKMLYSFDGWESTKINENKRRNVALKELESLHKLVCLEIQIKDIGLLEEEIQLPSIQNFKIMFGQKEELRIPEKSLVLYGLGQETIHISSWIHKLLGISVGLCFEGGCPVSLSKLLHQLEMLEIKNCEKMEAVFINEKEESSPIIFPKLKILSLYKLPNLITFGKGIESIEFPLLEMLDIRACPKLARMVSPMKSNRYKDEGLLNIILFNQKVKFGGLTMLIIQDLSDFTSLFSYSMAQNLVNLKFLWIKNCKEMEQLVTGVEKGRNNISFEIEEDDENKKQNNKEDGNMTPITFPKLEILDLHGLSSLTSIGEIESIEFPMLNQLFIRSCSKFKNCVCSFIDNNTNWDVDKPHNNQFLHLFCNPKVRNFGGLTKLTICDLDNFTSLFSSLMVQNLVNLKSLWIENCKEIKQVVIRVGKKRNNISMEIEEDDENKQQSDKDHEKMTPITFPKLEMLYLWKLSSLTSIGKEIESIEFPMLNKLDIRSCPKFKSCISSSMNNNTNWEVDEPYDNQSLHLFCDFKVKFGGLQYLFVEGYLNLSSMWCQLTPLHLFRTLERLSIYDCDNITSLLPSSIAQNLINLKVLSIANCEHLEQLIIALEKKSDELSIEIEDVGQKKQNEDDEKQISIVKGMETIEFPMLHELIIDGCVKLKSSVCFSMETIEKWRDNSAHKYEHDYHGSFHLFCNHQVKFNELKVLSIRGYQDISNMWCQHTSLYFFQTLEVLNIYGCNSIGNLFSSSIVETLVNLKELGILNCELMEQVIAADKEMQEHSILFPSLEKLTLEELPLLEMLCEWECAIECSLLERIIIKNCPRMKFLTQEFLNTPKLSYMKIDNQVYRNEDFSEMKDLNCFLWQNITTTRKEESSSLAAMEHGEIEEES